MSVASSVWEETELGNLQVKKNAGLTLKESQMRQNIK